MRFKFIGEYTNGHTSINSWGLVFEGREPLEVPVDLIDKFARHIEFEAVHPLDHDGELGGSLPDAVKPRKRGRPKKVVA
jgi:hypothetical protein